MRIAVIGAGLGGLTAAIALQRRGFDVTVYERSHELGEIGAGIQISPNASRVLHGLGLAEPLAPVVVRPAYGDLRRWDDGRLLTRQPLGDRMVQDFGFPYYHVHRAHLHQVLRGAVDEGRIRLGRRCTGIDSAAGDSVRVSFAGGEAVEADVVIGADGIHSAVRTALFGPEAPRFTGNTAWRGVVPYERVADLALEAVSTAVLGPDQHLVYYLLDGGRLVNWVGVTPSDSWTLESWTEPGEVDEALADFEGWNPVVRRLIGAVDATHRWALYDRDPLTRWSEGRVTLLGDAAHPMLPFMAQGAAQSIEDAAVLAGCLDQARHDPNAALRRYQDLRMARTSRAQLGSRANAVLFHLPDGPEQIARDDRFAAASGDQAEHRNAWLFGYKVEDELASPPA